MKLSNKFTTLKNLSHYIKNGTSIGIGGHHFARLPIALINQVLRNNPKNLEYISWAGGLALELFIQKKSLKKIQLCFSSLDIFGLAPSFRKICEEKSISVVDWTALGLIKALRAGQQNIDSEIFQYPWGSDLPKKTLFCQKFKDPRTKKLFAIVPSIKIDNFILHATRADEDGNVEIHGPRALDTLMVGASKNVLVTVDKVVPRKKFINEQKGSLISKNFITAISVCPYGAYPTSSVPYYITDYERLGKAFSKSPIIINNKKIKNRKFITKATKVDSKQFINYFKKTSNRKNISGPPTSDEIMAFALSKEYKNDSFCSSGAVSPLANVSYLLAKKTHAPKLVLTTMTYGHYDIEFRPMTLSYSEVLDQKNCLNFFGGDDSYSIYYQHGEITHEVIGAAQIDKYGDVNNIEIIKKSGGLLRLPGQGGMADVANFHENFICYITKHSKLSFVEKVDYVSAGRGILKDKQRIKEGFKPGKVKVFTNLCVFEKNHQSGLLEVISVHKGISRNEIKHSTGFKVRYSKKCRQTFYPSSNELKILRQDVDPLSIRKLEFTAGQERMNLFNDIIKREKKMVKDLKI